MKLLLVFVTYVTLSHGKTVEIPYDKSQYVDGESRYIWMFRDDGAPVLIDLQEPVQRDMESVGENNEYWLYTRQNPDDYQLLVPGDTTTLISSNFKADKPTYIIIHGWNLDGGNSIYNHVTKAALLGAEDCNVIAVDYHELTVGSYVRAVAGVPSVGMAAGQFVEWLLTTTGGDWNNVHLLGYSLGAHAVGSAGRSTGGRVARITGFDPAGPLWRTNSNALAKGDGQYVEAIHTNGGVMGILEPLGDVDFYPNGGVTQPGCSNNNCFHDRSYQFFAASVTTGHLVGRQCTDITQALRIRCSGDTLRLGGIDMGKKASGLYGLRTGGEWPF